MDITKNFKQIAKKKKKKGNVMVNRNQINFQIARIWEYLQKNRTMTTFQARIELKIMHPAARIMELRKKGKNISTKFVWKPNTDGELHRIGQYILLSENDRQQTKNLFLLNDNPESLTKHINEIYHL